MRQHPELHDIDILLLHATHATPGSMGLSGTVPGNVCPQAFYTGGFTAVGNRSINPGVAGDLFEQALRLANTLGQGSLGMLKALQRASRVAVEGFPLLNDGNSLIDAYCSRLLKAEAETIE